MDSSDFLGRWELRLDGPAMRGAVATVLPVRLPDGSPAALKIQPVDDETAGEADALRAWDGRGAVRLLRHDPDSGTMLLERLDPARTLNGVPDEDEAVRVAGTLLAGLNGVPAPAGMRRLTDLVAAMLDVVPRAGADRELRPWADACGKVAADLLPAADDRLLHWDLHFGNVLHAPGASSRADDGSGHLGSEPGRARDRAGRGPERAGQWLAIDPKPLAGESGFELLPALHNRWNPAAVMRRFDLMTEVMGLDRQRAAGWTLVRVLQNLLWDVEAGRPFDPGQPDVVIAGLLLPMV